MRPSTWSRLIEAATRPAEPDPRAPVATELAALLGLNSSAAPQTTPAIAVLRIRGLVMQHESIWSEWGLAMTTDGLAAGMRLAAADASIVAIVLDIDSPGGGVYGVDETAALIRSVREQKPVVAMVNSQAASAAYWLASAASEIVVTPSGEAGSIGVFAEHIDASGWYTQRGLVPTIVKAGRYKAEFADVEPLSEEARAELQRTVDEYYGQFLATVAAGRGVTPAVVRSDFGEGRMLSAKRAVAAGMADRVGTFEETLTRLVKVRRPASSRAEREVGMDWRHCRARLSERR